MGGGHRRASRIRPAIVAWAALFLSLALPPAWAGAVPMDLHPAASFLGELDLDRAGYTVAVVEDVNGDGLDDLLIGAPGSQVHGSWTGQAYLVLGRPSGWAMDTDLGLADASFLGETDGDQAGFSLAGAGDVDGDGFGDLIIGALDNEEADPSAGQVYLVLGRAAGWAMDTDLGAVDASFWGEAAGDQAGWGVAGAGDVDGDGFDDLLVGAPWNDEAGDRAGQSYLIPGSAGGWAMDTSLASAGASFLGEVAGDKAGRVVSGAGDVNGDGFDDLLVQAPDNSENGSSAGQVYLWLGPGAGWTTDMDLAQADASFLGEDHGSGWLAPAGDVNGDGYDDVLIGALYDGEAGGNAGQVYLWLGRAAGWAMDTDLGAVDASFLGETGGDRAGAVSPAGDVNGDGYDDLWIGAENNGTHGNDAGAGYLVLGRASGWAMDTDLSAAEGIFLGEAEADYAGAAVGGGGDVNGDGYDDLIVGAHGNDENGYYSGQTYLILGFPDEDQDGDGYGIWGGDCDDTDPAVHPGAAEVCNGVDDDCDGVVDGDDADGDGLIECDGDCDDTNASVYPGAPELCDGLDNDCDGIVADYELDLDGDGTIGCEECDDGDASVYPGAPETCDDGVDSDCADDLQETEEDDDGDGFSECGGDCDDADAEVAPDAEETCNGGIDDDCDELTDEDGDGDGDGHSICDGDCDDGDPLAHPTASEICDGIDNDCNGAVDDRDYDQDGYLACEDDCDDEDVDVHPGAPEVPYDTIDQDCDGEDLDDQDGDGYPGGPYGDDCDDGDPHVFPGAEEDCGDGVDGDCDGVADEVDDSCLPGEGTDCRCAVHGRGSARGWPIAAAALLAVLRRRLASSRRGVLRGRRA